MPSPLAPYQALSPQVLASIQSMTPRPMPAAPPVAPAQAIQATPPVSPFYQRNMAYVTPGEHVYNTPLSPQQEQLFRAWIQANQVPFDPSLAVSDYDMRGFWQALQAKDPRAMTAVDPNDNRLHYPDYWKTPYHESFSNESQWANPATAPHWNERDQLVLPDGTVLYDDRAPKPQEQ